MGIKIDDFVEKSGNNIITDEEQIYDICKKMLQLKLSDLAPVTGNVKHNPYRYAVRAMLSGFKIDTEKYMDEMTLEEFIFLFMLALEEDDFSSEEDTLFQQNFHATRCFRDLQVQKLSEGMLDATHNHTVNRFLNISLESFLEMIAISNASGNALSRREEIISIYECLSKEYITTSLTMKEVFEFAKNIAIQPWFPGTLPLFQYVTRSKMNVHFIALIMADSFADLFQICERNEAVDILEKYDSALSVSYTEMEDEDE